MMRSALRISRGRCDRTAGGISTLRSGHLSGPDAGGTAKAGGSIYLHCHAIGARRQVSPVQGMRQRRVLSFELSVAEPVIVLGLENHSQQPVIGVSWHD